ncbi:MAG: tetratricopeptide repeat protein [bacterium]
MRLKYFETEFCFVRILYALVLILTINTASSAQKAKSDKEFNFAEKLYEDKLFVLAAEQFKIFAEKYPNHKNADEALFLSGEAFFAAEDYSRAFEIFKQLEISYPTSRYLPTGRFRLAQCQNAQENFEASAELFKRVAFFHRESELAPKALFEAGRAFSKAGNGNAAVDIFLELIRGYPDTPQRLDAHLEIVNIYFRKGEYDKALNEIDGVFRALGPELNDPRTFLLRGILFEKMGQFEEAESIYHKVAQDFPSSLEAQKAHYRLGTLFQRKGLLEQALQHYDKSLSAETDSVLVSQIYLKKGEINFLLNQYQAALENFQLAARSRIDRVQVEAEFKSSKTLKMLQEYEKAAEKFAELISMADKLGKGTPPDTALIETAYLELADILIELRRFKDALTLIQEYSQKYAQSRNLGQMIFKKGEIFEKYLRDYSRALRVYDDFIDHYPFSPSVDDAQLALARCYEEMADYKLALREYDNYLSRYPGAESYDWALERKSLISETIQFDLNKEIQEIFNLFENFTEEKNRDHWQFELGKVYLKLRMFKEAVERFKLVVAKYGDGLPRDELSYYVALTYAKLAEKARFHNQKDQEAAYLDSAAVALDFLSQSQTESKWAEHAAFLRAKTGLSELSDRDARRGYLLELYSDWQKRYHNSQYFDFILINLANELLATSADSVTTFLQEALTNYQKIVEQFPKSKHLEEAEFRETITLRYLGADSIAMAKLSQFIETHPNSRYTVEALLLRAQWEQNDENFSAALNDLQRIQSDYFYSPLAAQAQLQMAEIYFQIGDFQSALDNYRRFDELWNEDRRANLRNTSTIQLKEAQAFEHLGQFSNALERYLAFVLDNPTHESLAEALLAVARIAQKQNNLSFAKEYYEKILQQFPKPEYQYTAQIALGDILFQEKAFHDARSHYLEARKLAGEISKETYPARQAIRCLYKLRKIAAADSEVKMFRKQFKESKMDEAQFLLDKGKACIANKDFQLAEKTFKKLRGDFKNTDYGAQGELGLGEVYLITNHTEQALKILTNIPSKYPESSVTPLTYYNLGDFYFKSQQVENAVGAFKQILVHRKAGEVYQKALRYLIKCYDLMHLWDQALATTREYLEKYPLADDSFVLKIRHGEFLMKLKEYDRAIEHFQQLLPYADIESEAEVQFYVGQCFKEIGNFRRATSEFLKVKYLTEPTKWPWHVTAQFEASKCLIRLGEIAQAKIILQRIIKAQGAESNFGRFARKTLEEIEKNDKSIATKENSSK